MLEAILGRIREAAIFVPDLTIVGRTDERDAATCNSNVLVEYGYALETVAAECFMPVVIFRGLSADAVDLVRLLVERSEYGGSHDPDLTVTDLVEALGRSEQVLKAASEELQYRGYVEIIAGAGAPFLGVAALPRLFVEFDHRFKPWNPAEDARTLAKEVAADDGLLLTTVPVDKWPVRRLNPAVHYLEMFGLVDTSDNVAYPYAAGELISTVETRLFAQGAIPAPHKRPRRG